MKHNPQERMEKHYAKAPFIYVISIRIWGLLPVNCLISLCLPKPTSASNNQMESLLIMTPKCIKHHQHNAIIFSWFLTIALFLFTINSLDDAPILKTHSRLPSALVTSPNLFNEGTSKRATPKYIHKWLVNVLTLPLWGRSKRSNQEVCKQSFMWMTHAF